MVTATYATADQATAVDASTRGLQLILGQVRIRTEATVALGCTVGAAITSHTPWHISTGQIPQAHGLCKHQSKHLFLTLTLTLAPVLQQP